MAQEWAREFYNGTKWLRCRNAYIQDRIMIDGGLCEECHNNLGYIVHHKVFLTASNISDPEISLNKNNLEYVCKDCHDQFEGHGIRHHGAAPLCRFDADGQPISLRDIDRLPPDFKPGISTRGPLGGD